MFQFQRVRKLRLGSAIRFLHSAVIPNSKPGIRKKTPMWIHPTIPFSIKYSTCQWVDEGFEIIEDLNGFGWTWQNNHDKTELGTRSLSACNYICTCLWSCKGWPFRKIDILSLIPKISCSSLLRANMGQWMYFLSASVRKSKMFKRLANSKNWKRTINQTQVNSSFALLHKHSSLVSLRTSGSWRGNLFFCTFPSSDDGETCTFCRNRWRLSKCSSWLKREGVQATPVGKCFHPHMSKEDSKSLRPDWSKAVSKAILFPALTGAVASLTTVQPIVIVPGRRNLLSLRNLLSDLGMCLEPSIQRSHELSQYMPCIEWLESSKSRSFFMEWWSSCQSDV